MSNDISLVMVVRNEAHRLGETVRLVSDIVKEICIVVQESDDETEVIAKGIADKVLPHPAYGFCEPSRPAAIDLASCEWILLLDADERITPFFREELEYIQNPFQGDYQYVGSWLPTRSVMLPQTLIRTDMPHYRFFRKNKVRVSPQLHGDILPIGEPVYEPRGVCLLNVKTWKEQYEDELRYEQQILSNTYMNDKDRENNLEVLLTINAMRKYDVTLEQIEKMTKEELEGVGIK